MSDENSICIVATVVAEQTFKIFSENAPSDDQIRKDFEAVKFTLDPAPPCRWKYELNNVHIVVSKEDNFVTRNFSLAVIINIDQSNIEFVKEMMADEGYYDNDDGFNWSSAINYFIADTTVAPDYADFLSENIDIGVMKLGS
jgi:hypothetical protein